MLPLQSDASDADDLLLDAGDLLFHHYGQEFAHAVETVRLIVDNHLDEIEVRRETANRAGLIQWQLGDDQVESTRGMLSAAAKAAAEPRKRFINAEAVISEEYLSRCYMGQTKVGSYVVTALAPAEALLATSRSERNASAHPRIKGRLITDTLMESLAAVRDAVAEARSANGRIEVFELAVSAGVSFELLDALAPLTRSTEAGIEITYTPGDEDGEVDVPPPAEFAFTPADGEVIENARKYFLQTPDAVISRLTGEVTDLKNSSSAAEHRIKLAARVNGRPKMVTVELTPTQYDSAVEAHRLGRLFTVTGELEVRQRGSYVRIPTSVHLEDTSVSEVAPTLTRAASFPTPPPLFDL